MVRSVNAGDRAIDYLRDITSPQMTFNENVDFETWKEQIKSKFFELTGYDLIKQNACPLNIKIEEEVECDGCLAASSICSRSSSLARSINWVSCR